MEEKQGGKEAAKGRKYKREAENEGGWKDMRKIGKQGDTVEV